MTFRIPGQHVCIPNYVYFYILMYMKEYYSDSDGTITSFQNLYSKYHIEKV